MQKIIHLVLENIIEEDDGYIDWLLKNEGTSEDIIKSIELLCGKVPPTTDDEDIKLSKQMLELINETGADIDSIYKYFKKTSKDILTKEEKKEAIEIVNKKNKTKIKGTIIQNYDEDGMAKNEI